MANCTSKGLQPCAGPWKLATGIGAIIVIISTAVSAQFTLLTINWIGYIPQVEYAWFVGFCAFENVVSPKSQLYCHVPNEEVLVTATVVLGYVWVVGKGVNEAIGVAKTVINCWIVSKQPNTDSIIKVAV